MGWRFQLSVILTASIALSVPGAAQHDALAQAKALYGSAAYDDALAMLDRLQQGSVRETGLEVALYRMFCLIVLDRGEEAAGVIEEIVTADPFFVPSANQASPRIRTIFEESRHALLPTLVRQLYADARDAFTRKDLAAAKQFEQLVTLLDDPGLRADASLADLRMLATGFRDLAAANTASAASGRSDPRASAGVQVATDADAGVIAPVPLSQSMPQWSPTGADARRSFTGELEVIIDERGSVSAARLRQPVHPTYDDVIVRQARSWKYRPATREGVPTRFLRVIRIQLLPPQ